MALGLGELAPRPGRPRWHVRHPGLCAWLPALQGEQAPSLTLKGMYLKGFSW